MTTDSGKGGAGSASNAAPPGDLRPAPGIIRIELERLGEAFHFSARSPEGNVVHLDTAPDFGGENLGVRPMQLLLMGLGGCSGIDIVSILRKQKQPLESLRILVDGRRHQDAEPALFETISVQFLLEGRLDPGKVRRAADLSMQKYCSVAKILEKTADISYGVTLNGSDI